jgi:hypothetical protein
MMKMFDVQGISLQITAQQAYAYISEPTNLPNWTSAFASVSPGRAMLQTPKGSVEIGLQVQASEAQGVIDWLMTFPDGSVATAYSRVVSIDSKNCAYTFVLTPPPVPLEMLEGALAAQALTLAEELQKLKSILENHA